MSLSQRCVSIQHELLRNAVADQWGKIMVVIANGAESVYPICTSTLTTPSCVLDDVHTYLYGFGMGGGCKFRFFGAFNDPYGNLNKSFFMVASRESCNEKNEICMYDTCPGFQDSRIPR